MNRKLAVKAALPFCLALALHAQTPAAWAQPITPSFAPKLSIVTLTGNEGATPLLTVRASETSAAAVLSLISVKTGAKILIKENAPIDDLEITRVGVSDAIEQTVKAAGLKVSYDKSFGEEGVYVVDKIAEQITKWPVGTFDMHFSDIRVADLVRTLAEQFKLKATVDTSAPKQTLDTTMFYTTPLDALQTLAAAAGLEIVKTPDGYLLKESAAHKAAAMLNLGFTDVPAVQFIEIISGQFDVKVELAPGLTDKNVDVDLANMTPVEALKATVKAADLDLSEENGVYIVRERAVTKK